jgi:drug/metabolite transporter (DMT)-like permease
MTLTLGGIAAVSLAIALTLMFKKMAKRTVVFLMLIAGLAGLGGILGSIIDRIVKSAVGGASSATDRLTGQAIGGFIIVAVLTICLWPHVKPKGQPPTRFTPWLAFVYGAVLYAVGGVFSQMAGLTTNIVAQGANLGFAALASFIQGF